MQGWVKLHRKLFFNEIFQNEKLLKVFIYCLMKATHKERKQLVGRRTVDLKPGQFVFGRNKAALELNMNPSTVRDYMYILRDDNVIDIKGDNKFSLVTVVNWELYQSDEEKIDSKHDSKHANKKTTKRQQKATNKNVENVKNEKNNKKKYRDYVFLTDDEYQRLVNEYGKQVIDSKIEDLDNYIGATGKKYKDHNRTLRMWLKRDNTPKLNKQTQKQNPDVDELERKIAEMVGGKH